MYNFQNRHKMKPTFATCLQKFVQQRDHVFVEQKHGLFAVQIGLQVTKVNS